KGNLQLLAKAIRLHVPLPFASIKNRRSVVSLSNLCDLIRHCIIVPQAAGQTVFAADIQALSTRQIVQLIARQVGSAPFMFPCPASLLKVLGRLFGRGGEVRRLIENLEVDMTETCHLLEWLPPL